MIVVKVDAKYQLDFVHQIVKKIKIWMDSIKMVIKQLSILFINLAPYSAQSFFFHSKKHLGCKAYRIAPGASPKFITLNLISNIDESLFVAKIS